MTNHDKYIVVGKIGSSFGVSGWVKVHTYTEFDANILEYSPWYINDPKQPEKTIAVEDGRTHGNGIIVKFAGIDTPEAARLLTGKLISIKRSQLPNLQPEEYYWSDLEGLTVINQEGVTLGKISYLIETGSNDVMVVKGQTDIAIPYLPGSVVIKIDLEKREMHVNWEPL